MKLLSWLLPQYVHPILGVTATKLFNKSLIAELQNNSFPDQLSSLLVHLSPSLLDHNHTLCCQLYGSFLLSLIRSVMLSHKIAAKKKISASSFIRKPSCHHLSVQCFLWFLFCDLSQIQVAEERFFWQRRFSSLSDVFILGKKSVLHVVSFFFHIKHESDCDAAVLSRELYNGFGPGLRCRKQRPILAIARILV